MHGYKGEKMTALPEIVLKDWENRDGPVCLATVDEKGIPNAIYATCVSLFKKEVILMEYRFEIIINSRKKGLKINRMTRRTFLTGSNASLRSISETK